MKNLYNYLLEVLRTDDYKDGRKFTVGGTSSHRILLFDIDETLLKCDAKTKVYNEKGELVRELTPEQYNFDKLKEGETYDFSEFRSIDGLLKSIMLPYWETLKREYKKGTHIGIITARGGVKMLKKFFLMKGINIKEDLIFAVGDSEELELSPTITGNDIAKNKAICVERLYKVGYKVFVFFDDNQDNLDNVKRLEKKLPIRVHTIKA